jgi:hypothetical protein
VISYIETATCEEAQVDYGEGPMVRDPASGKYKRTRLFVLTLGYSRKSVRLLTWRSSSQRWAAVELPDFRGEFPGPAMPLRGVEHDDE